MPKPVEALAALLTVFEHVMQRLNEERARRGASALSEGLPARRDPSPQLLRLECGDSTLDEFLAEKVESALAPLRGLLDEEDIAFLREWARERLDDDPVLTDLLAKITENLHLDEAPKASGD